jgi:hypothetical protein
VPNPRIRAIGKGTPAGELRARLFAAGSNQIKNAIAHAYYIEAICLIESWIGDRLECYLSSKKKESYAFKTLGTLISEFEKSVDTKIDQELREIVLTEVDKWRSLRNKATHNMMRIEKGDSTPWEERAAFNRTPAEEGLKLLRKIDNLIRKLLRNAKTN